MSREVVRELARSIIEKKRDCPLRVGIDGIDAAGKTFLADAVASYLVEMGHPVIRASIDGFHNPRIIRYRRGRTSPEGYYYDSFNYELLKKHLLEPLTPTGNRVCRLKVFDFRTETEKFANEFRATNAHILIFDGVFLFRREILDYWDFKIFVDIDYEVSLKRALERDRNLFGSKEDIRLRYQRRYIPGQKLYLETEEPQMKADVIINNNDFTKPRIKFRSEDA